MYLPLRLSVLLVATSKGDETCLEEESSLIQEPIQTGPKAAPLAGLLESARGMLANGATTDVTDFVQATLDEVARDVIPKIVDETSTDVAWLATEYAKFQDVLDDLTQASGQITTLESEKNGASSDHRGCRVEQSVACEGKRSCEMTLYSKWQHWENAEVHLYDLHEGLVAHFCPPDANGTLHTFRVNSITHMDAWKAAKTAADTKKTEYNEQLPHCNTAHGALEDKSVTCNSHQTSLEVKACDLGAAVDTALRNFHTEWAAIHASYQGVTNLIYMSTLDRHKEYRTLKMVQCLLDRIRERNGRPCDESTNEVTEEMTTCETVGVDLDICAETGPDDEGQEVNLGLCPTYQAPPQEPTLPTSSSFPCSAAWIAEEMGDLPVVPVGDFTSQNPGCNAYPDCSACDNHIDFPDHSITNYPRWVEPPAGLDSSHATFDDTANAYIDRHGQPFHEDSEIIDHRQD